ncbi:hypothetical protein [Candidatus Enterococcus ferrettii]|uniref:SdpI family protein n=1 Tax=Candidatus Enterococcus ferrettii TaxID=2815324 RepID=A0ABV0EXV3_9ENTE|nr:hypothetical protein [Enterococcus sp. 665A]MBO1341682.1 hypothetical protein [Enterococcus sp. 665A]
MMDWILLFVTSVFWWVIFPFSFDIAKSNNRYRCHSVLGFRSTLAVSSWKRWKLAQTRAKKFSWLAGIIQFVIAVPILASNRISEETGAIMIAGLLFLLLAAQFIYVQRCLKKACYSNQNTLNKA